MIGRRGERGSGISVLAALHDDDDDVQGKIYITSILSLCIEYLCSRHIIWFGYFV